MPNTWGVERARVGTTVRHLVCPAPATARPAPPHGPHLHTGDADAHGPDDSQVLLDEGLQLGDAAALVGWGWGR